MPRLAMDGGQVEDQVCLVRKQAGRNRRSHVVLDINQLAGLQPLLKQPGVGTIARLLQIDENDALGKILPQQVLRQVGPYESRAAE
jgi:hypothetical protein